MLRVNAIPIRPKLVFGRYWRPLLGSTARSISVNQTSPRITNGAYFHASQALTSSPIASAPSSEQPLRPPSGASGNTGQAAGKRRYGVILSIAIFLSLGYASGRAFGLFLIPPPLPKAGSQEDEIYLQGLEVMAERLPLVQELRAHPEEWRELQSCLGAAGSKQLASEKSVLNSTDTGQLEVSSLMSSMKGSFGIGYYRVFWNARENRTVTIVHLGVSLSGWPSIVHGGALATLLQENIESLVQLMREPAGMVVQRTSAKQSPSIRSLQLKYKRPTHAGRFYVIRTESDNSGQQRQNAVRSHIEDASSGLITAEAIGETYP